MWRAHSVVALLATLHLMAVSCARETAIPKPEHPRPDFQRDDWLNLNGTWDFRFDPLDRGLREEWYRQRAVFDRKIVVPFCWESKLSGIGELSPQQIGWYRREIRIPRAWQGKRVWLRFGAVDWEARVWVNGRYVGQHEGGYTPFEFDITELAPPGSKAELVVRAYDPTDRELPTGKQIASWYTFTSGIWQTVWLEARPETYLDQLVLVPQNRGGQWSLRFEATVRGPDGRARVQVSSPDPSVAKADGVIELRNGEGRYSTELAVSSPKLWTPETPHLYDLEIRVTGANGQTDRVRSYFGLRTIERARWEGRPYESILLNGKPVYLRGALDQSFNPEGIYTAPSDEFMRRDIELAKSMGLNMLRIHIKAEEPRRLYWADKLGILIMQDMPNTWEFSERAQRAWEQTMRAIIARDRNHPAIFAWVLFNETWGLGDYYRGFQDYRERAEVQDWVRRVWHEVKQMDPSRLVEDNSPNKMDHLVTDINSWHFYIDDYDRARKHIEEVVRSTQPGSTFNFIGGARQETQPLMNSEFGAVSAAGGDRDISWGLRYLTSLLRRHEKIQGFIYTELTDVEFEHNGLFNYDRSPKEFGYEEFVPKMTPADLLGADYVGFDCPPALVVKPGDVIEIPVFVSHFSERGGRPILRTWLAGVDDLGREVRIEHDGQYVDWKPYSVVQLKPLRFELPKDRVFVGAVALELLDEKEQRIAANFVNVVVQQAEAERMGVGPRRSPQRERLIDGRRVAISVSPLAFSAVRWTGPGGPLRLNPTGGREKFFFHGAGFVEYRFRIPKAVLEANPVRVGVLMELATKARDERMDWPQELTLLDRPQTDTRKFPGTVEIYLNGHPLEPVWLPDDPADARGVLSHLAAYHHGSYGYLVRGELKLDGLPDFVARLREIPVLRVTLQVPAGPRARGLSIYGDTMGRYPIDPTVIIETQREIAWPIAEGESGQRR